jgi:hypothetical protein
VARGTGLVSTLDLLGKGLTLFVGPDWDGALPGEDLGSSPLTAERLDAIAARGLGLTAAGSLLVRPDGYPVALSSTWRAAASDASSGALPPSRALT